MPATTDEIRERRQRLGMSRGRLAKLLHVGVNTIEQWEEGAAECPEHAANLLELLAEVAGPQRNLDRAVRAAKAYAVSLR
jgi:DNA-binding transcriptional regulator YiaG